MAPESSFRAQAAPQTWVQAGLPEQARDSQGTSREGRPSPRGPRYLDGECPHGVFRVLPHVLDADVEGPVGLLLCGPVVDALLGGGSWESGAGVCQLEQGPRGVSPPPWGA